MPFKGSPHLLFNSKCMSLSSFSSPPYFFLHTSGLFNSRVQPFSYTLPPPFIHTHKPPQEFAWWLVRFAHSRADLTLTTSPQLKKELEDHGIKRVDVWRKGVDTVRFDPKFDSQDMRVKLSDGHPDDFLMVYVGRLGAEKRCKDILPILDKMGPGTRLAVVGDGPQAEELRKYFEGTQTVFTGQLTGDELSEAFAR